MKYYLTTPIYYVNATPHIGHTYTTLVADTIKRFRRMMGDTAYLSTGTDEHGQNVERAARKVGWEPKYYADRVSAAFREEWDDFGIDYDYYVRTTDAEHERTVQWLFKRCEQNGATYKGSYTGQYCFNCEIYVVDANSLAPCPDCGRPTETVTEENYFFRLSTYEDRLLELYESNPEFIQPEARRNEVLSFVRGGLKDISISRSNLKWGIPLPEAKGHVFYVWFDALANYLTALGYGRENSDPKNLWPADLHLVGKEIVRFHAVYWPAFLMAADLPLPRCIYAHGWLIFHDQKMSKSRGNIVRAKPIDQVFGIEALRYYLLREIVFGQDGNFSYEGLANRYNADLANGLGNLTSRTLTMIQRYLGGEIVKPQASFQQDWINLANDAIGLVSQHFARFEFARGLAVIWSLLGSVDKYLVEKKPWKLAKLATTETQKELETVLYNSAEVLRIAAALLYPVMPKVGVSIWQLLGQKTPLEKMRLANLQWGQLEPGTKVCEAVALFPRLDVGEATEKLTQLEELVLKEQAKIMGKEQTGEAPVIDAIGQTVETAKIGIEDFAKLDLKVGQVTAAEKVEKTDRLLHLMVDIGEPKPRSIIAGIAEVYTPESLIGRKVVVLANLTPRKLRGIESDGMVVAALNSDGKPCLVGFHENPSIGTTLQ